MFNPRHQLSTGTEVLVEQMKSPRLASGEGTRTRFALFAQHEWQIFDRPRLALLPGLRFDADSQFGAHASPKLAVRWDPHPALAVRAAYGFGYRAPSFGELYLAFDNPGVGYMVAGNPQLEPEQSRSANLDFEWRPSQRVRSSIGLFRSDIENLIISRLRNPGVVGAPSLYSYDNISAAHTQGVEATVGIELVKGLNADLSYTLTLARDDELDRPLEGRARDRGTFRLGYRHPGAGFGINARGALVGSRPFYVDNNQDDVLETETAKPYATLGVRVAQVIWRRDRGLRGRRQSAERGRRARPSHRTAAVLCWARSALLTLTADRRRRIHDQATRDRSGGRPCHRPLPPPAGKAAALPLSMPRSPRAPPAVRCRARWPASISRSRGCACTSARTPRR